VNTLSETAQRGSQRVDQLRERALRAWHEAPPWVRSPAAIAGCVALLMIALLVSLALVVQGVVQRGQQLNQAWASEQHKPLVTTPVATARR
jgi:ABC-type Fe3+ transport system permease subunit